MASPKWNVPIPVILFCLLAGTLRCMPLALAAEKNNPSQTRCHVHKRACTTSLPQTNITFDINPKPVQAMKDLTFTIRLSGKEPSSEPYLDLGMPGMNMGPNRVNLKPMGAGIYRGKGIIVRCPSGRKTWRARLTLPGLGATEFLFDVAD